MDNVKHHDKATTHLSLSPPNPSEPLSQLPSPNSAALAALANARWVPTREQIAVLEGLYSQGMRNPTLKQIHQVAARLQEHGPIEPKNVFYWFESQTFRLGDRNMQQSFDYVSRQFRPPQPLTMLHSSPNHPFSPVQLQASPTPNTPTCNKEVVCMQQACYPAAQTAENAAYYMQAHENIHAQASCAVYYQATTQNNTNNQQSRAIPSPRATGSYGVPDASWRRPVTLNLFPQYPTFANREKDCHTVSVAGSARPSTSGSFSCDPRSPEILTGDPSRSFYDFPGEGHEDKH